MIRSTQGVAARTARRGGSKRGFTLIELMISLVAGLLVAMAVMGVSREATNTFHEEVRVSGAEMSIRIAMERLRMDLQRAAFMSTGNIVGDPLVARAANFVGSQPQNLSNATLNGATGYIAPELKILSGVLLRPGGATVGADATNGLTPDRIDIGGNFTSSDEYVASIIWPNKASAAATSPVCGTGLSIALQMNTPAAGRIVAAEVAGIASATSTGYVTGSTLEGLFHPGPPTSKNGSQSLVRITDQSGRYQYALLAAGGVGSTTIYNPGTTPGATVCLDSKWGILKTSDTGGLGGVSGFGAGWVVVSPVEVVRWDIQSYATATAAIATSMAAAGVTLPSYSYGVTASATSIMGSANENVLTRSFLDFSPTGLGGPDGVTTEIVAEYAVDLKFGLTIDQSTLCPTAFPCPITAPTYTTSGSPLIRIGVDQATAMATAQTAGYLAPNPAAYTANIGPQRIRDVLVRLGVRSQFGDRTVNIAPSDAGAGGYLYRYNLAAGGSGSGSGSGTLSYARVREITSEVNLPNQARFYY